MNFKRRWNKVERMILRAGVNEPGLWTVRRIAKRLNMSPNTISNKAGIFRRMGFLVPNISTLEATELGRRKCVEFGGDDNHV